MEKLIVIADPGVGKNSALKRACEIRAQSDAEISFLGFTHNEIEDASDLEDAGVSAEEMKAASIDYRYRELDESLTKLNIEPGDVNCEVIWSSDLPEEVIKYCKTHKAEMIIKSGNRSETWIHTSTDWQLFRNSPVPVMITDGKSWRKKSRVLVAVDLATKSRTKQKLNDKSVEQAKYLADLLGDEVHLAYAITVPKSLVDLDVLDPKKYLARKKKKLEPIISKFCDRHNIDAEHVHLKPGAPDRVIPSIANSLKADLVVAGTIGRKGVKGKLVGNTAEGILGKLHADILAVRP